MSATLAPRIKRRKNTWSMNHGKVANSIHSAEIHERRFYSALHFCVARCCMKCKVQERVRLGLGVCTWSGQPLASILMVSSTTDALSSGRMHEL